MFRPTEPSIPPPEYASQRDMNSPALTVAPGLPGWTDEELEPASRLFASPSPRPAPLQVDVQGVGSRLRRRWPSHNSLTSPQHEHRPLSSITARSELTSRPSSHQVLSQSAAGHGQTNYVALSRKTTPRQRLLLPPASASIKGSFVINPYLHIPAALLSPLPEGQTKPRKNLKLEVENGGINVNIFLVGRLPDDDTDVRSRTSFLLKLHGKENNTFPLVAKIHTPVPDRQPFHLTAIAIDGYLSLHLPSSFYGVVKVKVDAGDLENHLSLSHLVAYNSTILSETSTMRCYFVGELGGWSKDEQDWVGDKATVVVQNGKIRLQIQGEKDWDSLQNVAWRFGI